MRGRLTRLEATPPGIGRHASLVGVFIEASELTQGLCDAEFDVWGEERRSPVQDASMALLLELARAVISSWCAGLDAPVASARAALKLLTDRDLPDSICTRVAEGYAYYALYPECYAQAALASGLGSDAVVIGLRSIGAGLAAIVAAALQAAPPITLRPIGEPFQRRLALSPSLRAELAQPAPGSYAIVDEGPGLSGSSFGAVADLLEGDQVQPDLISFFPGHDGDLGPQASEPHRARWARARRFVVDLDTLVLKAADPRHNLVGWAAELVGEPTGPADDLSGGAWRSLKFSGEAEWPPANTFQERRKFLVTTRSGRWLLKFVGLGWRAEAAFERAKALSHGGFCPEVLGLRHGFMIQRWAEARSVDLESLDRSPILARLGAYLRFRACNFPAELGSGCSTIGLLEMAQVNATEALGSGAAACLEPWRDRLVQLQAQIRPCDTDNRLHAWEWLCTPDSELLKTDAVDHAHAHDLIGCQDIAWDIAGAAVEFNLSPGEQASLAQAVHGQSDRDSVSELVDFYVPAYLAFQLGAYDLAARAHAGWPEERNRLAAQSARYRAQLQASFAQGRNPNPQH